MSTTQQNAKTAREFANTLIEASNKFFEGKPEITTQVAILAGVSLAMKELAEAAEDDFLNHAAEGLMDYATQKQTLENLVEMVREHKEDLE